MNIRRRTPTVFNLSMVDIMCCALGCVILMWLMFSREAKKRTIEASTVAKKLSQTLALLDDTKSKFKKTQAALTYAESEKNRLGTELQNTSGQLTAKNKKLKQLEMELGAIVRALADKKKTAELLTKKMRAALLKIDSLEGTLKTKNAALVKMDTQEKNLSNKLADLTRIFDSLNRKYSDSQTTIKSLTGKLLVSKKTVDDLTMQLAAANTQTNKLLARLLVAEKNSTTMTSKLKLSQEEINKLTKKLANDEKLARQLEQLLAIEKNRSMTHAKKLATSQATAQDLGKKLTKSSADLASLSRQMTALLQNKTKLLKYIEQANITITDLQAAKNRLAQEKNKLRAAFTNRFAGINLTGKRVLFLVDVSGSMTRLDSNTLKPDKWPEVCATLTKVMRSLPDLTHYQVIVFAERHYYPLGNPGVWLTYNAKTSPQVLRTAMKKIQPEGGTKMLPAFEEAFRRFGGAGKLDTIYLISDGLPNSSDNLPAEAATLTGVQLTAYLSQRVRQQLRTVWNRAVNGTVPVRINSIGFFFESPEVGAFLWALSRENNGSFVGMSRP